MIGFIIGLMLGGFFGVALMALMQIASDADGRAEMHSKQNH
ncbi:DUF3789 domain-containing protein [uncultured Ruminococcus sp.]|nr:DUF3789 domain-containing protein [uncultured Ruminococcus sp.]